MMILLVRDPLSSITEPNNVIRLLCSRVDRLSLSRAVGNAVVVSYSNSDILYSGKVWQRKSLMNFMIHQTKTTYLSSGQIY